MLKTSPDGLVGGRFRFSTNWGFITVAASALRIFRMF
jgi:hypothetical protein